MQPPRSCRSFVAAVPHAASRRLPCGRQDFARFEGLRAQVNLCCRAVPRQCRPTFGTCHLKIMYCPRARTANDAEGWRASLSSAMPVALFLRCLRMQYEVRVESSIVEVQNFRKGTARPVKQLGARTRLRRLQGDHSHYCFPDMAWRCLRQITCDRSDISSCLRLLACSLLTEEACPCLARARAHVSNERDTAP